MKINAKRRSTIGVGGPRVGAILSILCVVNCGQGLVTTTRMDGPGEVRELSGRLMLVNGESYDHNHPMTVQAKTLDGDEVSEMVDTDSTFKLRVARDKSYIVNFNAGDSFFARLVFATPEGSETRIIPAGKEAVLMGKITIVGSEARAEHNPLALTDSDDNGVNDLFDAYEPTAVEGLAGFYALTYYTGISKTVKQVISMEIAQGFVDKKKISYYLDDSSCRERFSAAAEAAKANPNVFVFTAYNVDERNVCVNEKSLSLQNIDSVTTDKGRIISFSGTFELKETNRDKPGHPNECKAFSDKTVKFDFVATRQITDGPCSKEPVCRSNDDCQIGTTCSFVTGKCVPRCLTNDDCCDSSNSCCPRQLLCDVYSGQCGSVQCSMDYWQNRYCNAVSRWCNPSSWCVGPSKWCREPAWCSPSNWCTAKTPASICKPSQWNPDCSRYNASCYRGTCVREY